MRVTELFLTVVFSVVLLLACAPSALGQDPQPPQDNSEPRPAARAVPPVTYAGQESDQDSTPSLQPDSRPLTGVQSPTLGRPEIGHSYVVPGVQAFDTARSISLNQPTGSDWSSVTYLAGSLDLYRVTSHSELSADYTGGGFFSTQQAQGNGFFHEMEISQSFKWRRWRFSLIDQFSYLPESSPFHSRYTTIFRSPAARCSQGWNSHSGKAEQSSITRARGQRRFCA